MKGKIMQLSSFKMVKGFLIYSFLFVFLSIIKPAGGETIVMSVDSQAPGKPLKHVWSFFGFDECNFAYTDGAKELMKTLSTSEKDPIYLRCHFLLNTGDGTPAMKWGSTNAYTEDASGKPVYSWTIMDKIFDAKINSGCVPLVEIGFMPKALSVKPDPYQHVYPPQQWAGWAFPPNDYNKWSELIRQWAKHSVERYGDKTKGWLWELWNEPDIFYFHNAEGKQATVTDYEKLFDYTEKAFHEVMPNGVFGGPHVTSPAYAAPARFLRSFLQHCVDGNNFATGKKGTRLDYIGFHSKGNTSMVEGHPRVDLGANLRSNQRGFGIVAEF
jgi:xylan 1,4-beta-xylosidase